MKKQIKRISIFQTSKVTAVLYALLGFVYSALGLLMILFGGSGTRILGIVYLFMPIIGSIFGFIFIALSCWVYNRVARRFGGIEFEIENIDAGQSEAASSI